MLNYLQEIALTFHALVAHLRVQQQKSLTVTQMISLAVKQCVIAQFSYRHIVSSSAFLSATMFSGKAI